MITLRRRLAVRYGVISLVCLFLLAGLAHHEFVTEPRLRAQHQVTDLTEDWWAEFAEVFFYGMMPLVMGIGWWTMRRVLNPIDQLVSEVERIQLHNLPQLLPQTHKGDEVDRLTEAFNKMTMRSDASLRQMQEFTLHASHELKTPLTVMRAELETELGDEALTEEWKDWILCQLDEVQRMTKIVEALTFLAKTDADQVRLEMQPVELGELIRESFEDAIVLAEPHNVQVSLLTCDDLTIRGDRHRLRQVLLNLVDNAVKYNRHGGTVTMSLQRMNDSAVIEIVNTGKGVSAEAQEQVFDRFMRGDNAVMSAIDGSGLGLTIARWIVQSHCGAIQFISVPDQQTTVRVCLPLDNVVSAV